MTEEEWLSPTDPEPMLRYLFGKATERKLRLFTSGCCRRLGVLLKSDTDRSAVEFGERLAEGEPVQKQVEHLRLAIDWRIPGAPKYAIYPNAFTAATTAHGSVV